MGQVEAKLRQLGIELPKAAAPVASYVPTVRTGNLVLVSGQIPMVEGKLMATGRVPKNLSLEEAHACARRCALNGLAALKAEIGDLDLVARVVRLGIFVACTKDFTDQSKVANGASDLMLELFGDAGRHARAAVGCPSLPLNAPVEIEFLFEVR